MKAPINLDDKSACMIVDFNKLGNSRRVGMASIEVDADKTMLRVNKSLLDSPEFDAIKQHDGYTKRWLYTRSLPSMFKEGIFRIPNTLLVEVDEYLQARAKERAELVKQFKTTYPERVASALERLATVGNVTDYLSTDEAASKFSLAWRFVSFSVPDSLKAIKDGLFERERDKTAKLFVEANDEIKNLLRVSMAKLVDNMADRMKDKDDGTKKIFKDSSIGNVNEFLENFDARNIVDDSQLQTLVNKARKLMDGVDPDILRKSKDIRAKVAKGFESIKSSLDKMIVDKPSRKFNFED